MHALNNIPQEPMNIATGNVEDLLLEMKNDPAVKRAASFIDCELE